MVSVAPLSGASLFNAGKQAALANGGLSEAEQKQVNELKKTDAKVRAHEQAHKSVGGPYASAPSYQYVRGPDGQNYAVAGEVKIDTSPEPTPDQTIRKMEIVIRAALAPAEPSAQDRAVAAAARAQMLAAQAELRAQSTESPTDQTNQTSPLTLIKQAIESYKNNDLFNSVSTQASTVSVDKTDLIA